MTEQPEKKKEEPQWWEAHPAPRAKCPETTADELMKMFDDMDIQPEPRSFLLVDVRRTDWEGGTIKSSINLPAQSFYQSRKVLLELCDRANIREVIFYCGGPTYITSPFSRHISHIAHIGASNGRGPRCAAWMQDYIDDISKFGRKTNLKVFTLKGGIKGWVKDFEGALVDGFVEGYWEQFK